MTVQQAPMKQEEKRPTAPAAAPSLSLNRPIAIFLWVVACITTYQFVGALRPDLDQVYMAGTAISVQLVFTWLERPFLRGKPNKISTSILALDTMTNAGGVYPLALRAPETPAAQMIIAAFSMEPSITPLAAMILSLVAGFLLAAAPEAVWRWRD